MLKKYTSTILGKREVTIEVYYLLGGLSLIFLLISAPFYTLALDELEKLRNGNERWE